MSYPRIFRTPGVGDFAEKVDEERIRQLKKWGEQRHKLGTGRPGDREEADRLRAVCKATEGDGDNWRDILAEEIGEAFAETDFDKLEEELVQCAAVIQAWLHDIQCRKAAMAFDGDGRE